MTDDERVVWGIHGGKSGDANSLFLDHDVVALGWELGDLSELNATREAFKVALASFYPDKKPGAIPVEAGQLFRFTHEMNDGDLIVYPSKMDRKVHIGEITGSYHYVTAQPSGYPHQRAVKWLKTRPRTLFSQGALYEVGSAMSFFQVKNYADEFRTALTDTTLPIPSGEDESIGIVAEELEQVTRDFVLKRLSETVKGHPFEHLVASLLQTMGYRTRVSPEGADGGIDVIAHRDELGFEPPIIKVQVKSGDGSVGEPVVSGLYGKVSGTEFALLVTLGSLTPQARQFERAKGNLRLIDGGQFVDLLLEHYEELDPQYKGLLPLKRVYVPEPLANPGEL